MKEQNGNIGLWLVRLIQVVEIDAATDARHKLCGIDQEARHRHLLSLVGQRGGPVENGGVEYQRLHNMGQARMMHKDLDHSPSLRPAIEYKMLRALSERVLDGGLQVLPLAITQMISAIVAVRSVNIVVIGNLAQWQASLSQWCKGAQGFVARGSPAMHQNSPCIELARHIPGRHCSQRIWHPYIANSQTQAISNLTGVYIARPEDRSTRRKRTRLIEKLARDRILVRGNHRANQGLPGRPFDFKYTGMHVVSHTLQRHGSLAHCQHRRVIRGSRIIRDQENHV